MIKKQFRIKTGALNILLYIIALNICLANGDNRRGQSDSRPEYWKCSFGKPTIIIENDEENKNMLQIKEAIKDFNLESETVIQEEQAKKRIVKPVGAGWSQVKKKTSYENLNSKGIRQLINLIGKLLNGIGNAPIIPFVIASNGDFDTISVYALGEEKPGTLVKSIKHQMGAGLEILNNFMTIFR